MAATGTPASATKPSRGAGAARYNATMKTCDVLGSVSTRDFLHHYWQQKPLLIRQAIPDFQPILSRDALFGLAARDEVESRLITHFRGQWKLQHGPFDDLPAVSRKNWTVLVQGVNLHDDQADRLLNRFRFLPDARLDDLMISYATDTGGVGPHFDSYDVFLLQAQGQRRWRVGAQKDRSLVDGLPVKLLRNFTPTEEYVLDPGDMLYLPPQWAHDGVAVGECMTYSIGFRAPSWQELGEAFLNFMADNVDLPGRYTDPGLAFSKHPAKIGDEMLDRVSRQLEQLTARPDDMAIFLGEYLTEPKPNLWFTPLDKPLSLTRFQSMAQQRGLRLDRKSRMLYRSKFVFINGESFQPTAADRRLLQELADQRQLAPDMFSKASPDLQESLHQWTIDGWLRAD
jgi:50S ribosomal protein L16 3-hydroxylase